MSTSHYRKNQAFPFLKSVSAQQVWAIFDVDRVLINTTSWHYALTVPDLLLSPQNIERYNQCNKLSFDMRSPPSRRRFRHKMLTLLNKKVTPRALELARGAGLEYIATRSAYVDEAWLRIAGAYTAHHVCRYESPIRYLRFLSKLHGASLHVLFLSAGYQPFIEGLIDKILEDEKLTLAHYHVCGSALTLRRGIARETFCCYGSHKRGIAAEILRRKARIIFAADDDAHNESLLHFVRRHGGEALKIEHVSKQRDNNSWRRFERATLSTTAVRTMLTSPGSKLAPLQHSLRCPIVRTLRQRYDGCIDQAGNVFLSRERFQTAMRSLRGRLPRFEKVRRFFEEFTWKKGARVYLRSTRYYHWLPAYLTLDSQPTHLRWKTLMSAAHMALQQLFTESLLMRWRELSNDEQLLLMMVVDHYKSAVLEAAYTIFHASVCGSEQVPTAELEFLDRWLDEVVQFFYALMLNVAPRRLPATVELSEHRPIAQQVEKYSAHYTGMRELDDSYKTALAALSLLQQRRHKGSHWDVVINFLYGGFELGLALRALHRILEPRSPAPEVLHSLYSHRRCSRSVHRSPKLVSSPNLLRSFPRNYLPKLKKVIANRKSVLLYDHNVTTYRTLSDAQGYFRKRGVTSMEIATAAVNYDNLSRWLCAKPDAEQMCANWSELCSYRPAFDYLSAFSTWGTSQKGALLAKLFERAVSTSPITSVASSPSDGTSAIFKACRVHNTFDLSVAAMHGATAIGIHAVHDDASKYFHAQIPYHPPVDRVRLGCRESMLPVALFEAEGIRKMVRLLPSSITPYVVFERPASEFVIRRTLATYRLSRAVLQFQHRVTAEYLSQLRDRLSLPMMPVVGGAQSDFVEYFTFLQSSLNPDQDLVLIDLSKHQPDIISGQAEHHSIEYTTSLRRLGALSRVSPVPIVLANDTEIPTMQAHLAILKNARARVVGIDMQNCLEFPAHERRFIVIDDTQSTYPALLRKCPNRMATWGRFFQDMLNGGYITEKSQRIGSVHLEGAQECT